ncbi:Dienelactone hydrolase family protein [Planctomycetes bacterium Poly30]|uniref:Dienelactone hydrolase family protein n=1 Tax=Saltatorellus ferox TaxID=2528018 RepID=A0A518EXC6_9BACT|nr:Dienelactone hydrolase family protein [Planctomycetes bacterium Poly30]
MCDEFTSRSDEANLSRRGLTRREFAALGASAALAGCSAASLRGSGSSELTEQTVEISTQDGIADAFFVHPATGQHAAVIMWPDVAGLRESKRVMARALAAEGHAVLVVNQYYRGQPAPLLETFADWRTPEGKAKIAPLRQQLDPEAITRDARAFVDFLDAEEHVDKNRGIGSCGYCMGGSFTVRTAAAAPGRVRAAASFHGGGLATDAPDSPHRLLSKTEASFLFAIAQNDDERDPEAKVSLREAADAADRPAEIEVYPADHGWCVPDSPAWNEEAAARAFQRMLVLFGAL